MLLSHRYNFLFVHIAKTGGTSFRSALRPRIWADPYRVPLWICSRFSGWSGHRLGVKFPRHAKVIAAIEMLPADFFDQLFKFTVVRNPWDLQVSSYHHIRRERPRLMAEIEDFDAFIRWKFSPERPYHYIFDASVEPQRRSVIDLNGNCRLDFIGRFERLVEDFGGICERIGLHPVPALPHKRRAKEREDYRTYYSDWSAAFIERRFKEDIDMFGYSFDSAPEQGNCRLDNNPEKAGDPN